jgi:N utilization substance protein B
LGIFIFKAIFYISGGFMTRREKRVAVFQILYMMDFYESDLASDQIENFLADQEFSDDEKSEIKDEANGVLAALPEIDEMISEKTEGWKISRIPKVDLSIIRLSIYEFKYGKLDTGIAINEAVEIAKEYGDENSGSFVNGVLARMV